MTQGEAVALLTQCRVVLEFAWPVMRGCGSAPPLANGRPVSWGCCIHSALFAAAALNLHRPDMIWTLVGGAPTDRSPAGGYLDDKGEAWMHCWASGARRDLPGKPVILADLTADQFGGPAVRYEPVPVVGYLGNLPPGILAGYAQRERDFVVILLEMLDEARRLDRPA